MPIQGPASYIPTTQAFLAHWAAADTALGALGPLTLSGEPLGFPAAVHQAQLESLFGQLDAQHTAIQDDINGLELARGDLDKRKVFLLDKLNQFNDKVRADLAGSRWEGALPAVPNLGVAQSYFTTPLEDAASLWTRLQAADALGGGKVFTLRGPYALATFTQDIVDLKAAYRAAAEADLALGLARGLRNELQAKIYPILKAYRAKVPVEFDPGSAIATTLPLLTPARGHTPDPVPAQGAWDAAAAAAKITFGASTDADLDHYELRWSPGVTDFSTDDESTLASLPANAPLREFHSAKGLAEPGATSLFRVVVVLTTGNEAGSPTVRVSRPG